MYTLYEEKCAEDGFVPVSEVCTGEIQKSATCDQGECDKIETEHQLHLRKAQKASSSLQENKELAKHS
jgi:hypothetical protein